MTLILDIWSPKFFCAPPDILSIICEILVNIRSLVSEEFANTQTYIHTYIHTDRQAYSINNIDGLYPVMSEWILQAHVDFGGRVMQSR